MSAPIPAGLKELKQMTGTSKVLAYIHETAVVAPTARIARDVEIGPYAVIMSRSVRGRRSAHTP